LEQDETSDSYAIAQDSANMTLLRQVVEWMPPSVWLLDITILQHSALNALSRLPLHVRMLRIQVSEVASDFVQQGQVVHLPVESSQLRVFIVSAENDSNAFLSGFQPREVAFLSLTHIDGMELWKPRQTVEIRPTTHLWSENAPTNSGVSRFVGSDYAYYMGVHLLNGSIYQGAETYLLDLEHTRISGRTALLILETLCRLQVWTGKRFNIDNYMEGTETEFYANAFKEEFDEKTFDASRVQRVNEKRADNRNKIKRIFITVLHDDVLSHGNSLPDRIFEAVCELVESGHYRQLERIVIIMHGEDVLPVVNERTIRGCKVQVIVRIRNEDADEEYTTRSEMCQFGYDMEAEVERALVSPM
jgi:hypothetical protein